MEIKEATMQRLIEERRDLKNYVKKTPIWADGHLTRLDWDWKQFESLISDLETRTDQLKEVVRSQGRRMSACTNEGTRRTGQLP